MAEQPWKSNLLMGKGNLTVVADATVFLPVKDMYY